MSDFSEKHNLHIETLKRFYIGLTRITFQIDGQNVASPVNELGCDDFLGSFLEVHGENMNGATTLIFIDQLLTYGHETVSIVKPDGSTADVSVCVTGVISTDCENYEWDDVSSPW